MKSLILCHNLYADITPLTETISSMEYASAPLGDEIENFQFMPQGLEDQFNYILNEQLELQGDMGIFRKPNAMIHYEPFYQHAAWLCIVALAPTQLTIHQHLAGHDVQYAITNPEQFDQAQCLTATCWRTLTSVAMEPNDFVFIRPWAWHSLSENQLVQIFLLNQNLSIKDI